MILNLKTLGFGSDSILNYALANYLKSLNSCKRARQYIYIFTHPHVYDLESETYWLWFHIELMHWPTIQKTEPGEMGQEIHLFQH
jgi:hypothetical protein